MSYQLTKFKLWRLETFRRSKVNTKQNVLSLVDSYIFKMNQKVKLHLQAKYRQ